MSNFAVNPAFNQIDKIISSINALPDQVNLASVFAINRTAEWLKSAASKEISAEKRVKLKIIRDRMKIMRANKKQLAANINADMWALKGKDLGDMSQSPIGATAGNYFFKGAFVATMKSSHKGVFRRKGTSKLPIKEQYIMLDNYASKLIKTLIDEQSQAVFERNFQHQIKRLTGAI